MSYQKLYRHVKAIPIVETHEHQVTEAARIKTNEGWALLFDGYAISAMTVAGMNKDECAKRARAEDPADLWDFVEPYFRAAEHTAYLKAVKLSAEMVYGFNAWNRAGVLRLDAAVRKSHKPGVVRKIIRDIGNIDHYHVNPLENEPYGFFREKDDAGLVECDLSSMPFTTAPYRGKKALLEICRKAGGDGGGFRGFKEAMDAVFEKHGKRAIAVKNQSAYTRRIDFSVVDEKCASAAYSRFIKGTADAKDRKVISDWAMCYSIEKAADYKLPVKIHTGYLAGNDYMRTGDVDPCLLEPLFLRFPNVKFDLFHIGYPFVDKTVSLVKHFTNVYADMCWAWALDFEAAGRFLRQFITAAPHTKVFAAGGDTMNAEGAVGHVELARRGVARSLAALVDTRYLSLKDAKAVSLKILRENALSVFGRKN